MSGPVPYLHLDGTAEQALRFYRGVFGGDLDLHTFVELGRTDGEPGRIAHGALRGPVELFAADVGDGEPALRVQGMLLSLLGAAEPPVLTGWFAALAEGGEVVDPLRQRPWGDHDGQVRDAYGLTWLIGFAG